MKIRTALLIIPSLVTDMLEPHFWHHIFMSSLFMFYFMFSVSIQLMFISPFYIQLQI